MDAPQIDVVRGLPGLTLRAAGTDAMPTLAGHFSRFDEWYEIHSWFEGDFLERMQSGCFKETFARHWDEAHSHKVKVQFQHGYDPAVGQRLLGKLTELREDNEGGYYEAPLFDTSYNRDLVPGLDAGEYGASFRFRVTSESWDMEPGPSGHNPKGLPERTITGCEVHEVGPVAFGASPTATAGLRSLTDEYYDAVRAEQPRVFEDACRAAGRALPGDVQVNVNGSVDARDVAAAFNQAVAPRRRNGGGGRRAQRTELKALPDAVLARDRGIDLSSITARRRKQELVEARRLTPNLKVEQNQDAVKIAGYAVTYDEPRTVAGDAGWTENWMPGACTGSVSRKPDVRLTLNGEGEPLARSMAGTLALRSDDYGLHVEATIDPTTSCGEDVALALQRGEAVDMLVMFDVTRQRWNDDHTHRMVDEVYLHDMSILIDGWDPATGEDLSRLHVETPAESEPTMSLELMRMINDTI